MPDNVSRGHCLDTSSYVVSKRSVNLTLTMSTEVHSCNGFTTPGIEILVSSSFSVGAGIEEVRAVSFDPVDADSRSLKLSYRAIRID